MREFLDRFTGNISAPALLASVFFWSWMDLVPFSPLLATSAGAAADAACLAASLLVASLTLCALFASERPRRLVLKPLPFAAAALALGCLGTLSLFAGYLWDMTAPLLAGAVLSGLFQAAGVALVGSLAVCQGKTNALIHIAACLPANIVFVLLGMFLQPGAAVFLCCTLPLLCALAYQVYLVRGNNAEVIRTVCAAPRRVGAPPRSLVGETALLLLVTFAFGFVNCRVQFAGLASVPGPVTDYCSLFVRAVVAGGVFCAYVFHSRQPFEFLLVAVAAMALGLFALWLTPLGATVPAVASSTLFFAGYALFDLLVWAVLVILHKGSAASLQKFLCAAYAVDQFGNFAGTACGMAPMTEDACALVLAALGACLLVCAFVVMNLPGSPLRDLRGALPDREDLDARPDNADGAGTACGARQQRAQGDVSRPEQGVDAPQKPTAPHDIRRLASRYFLTEREGDILALLFSGRSVPYIAEQLVVSPNTVKTHVRHIYAKLDVHNRQELLDLFERPENK